jgi:hypothetical protein
MPHTCVLSLRSNPRVALYRGDAPDRQISSQQRPKSGVPPVPYKPRSRFALSL